MEMVYICAAADIEVMQTTTTWNVASVTKELNFTFYLINLHINNHMWLTITTPKGAALQNIIFWLPEPSFFVAIVLCESWDNTQEDNGLYDSQNLGSVDACHDALGPWEPPSSGW